MQIGGALLTKINIWARENMLKSIKKKVTSVKIRHQFKQAAVDCYPIRRQCNLATARFPSHHHRQQRMQPQRANH